MKRALNQFKMGFLNLYRYTNQFQVLKAIRESLLRIVPVIMIGAGALVLRSFPIKPYLDFVQNFAGGVVDRFMAYVYNATFGVLSIYMVISLSVSYVDKVRNMAGNYIGPVFSSLLVFVISSGAFEEGADLSSTFGTRGLFTAILCALFGSCFYCSMQKRSRMEIRFYTNGADDVYNNMLKYLVPILLAGLIAALFNLLLFLTFHVSSLQEAYTSVTDALFLRMNRGAGSAVFYIFMVHFLWFFGIHGGNVFETVGQNVFEPALLINQKAIELGQMPTQIFSKTFFDVFVIMGGCGSTFCLLLTILFFERKRSIRKLAKIAAIPSIFNINELMVFGIPIVYNPIMFIPFFLTPMMNLLISALAMRLGLVPVVSNPVEWTTPILLGGYYATGSISGAVLQLVNLCLGVGIYYPFIKILDRQSEEDSREKINKLVKIYQKSEETRNPMVLLEIRGEMGNLAKTLCDGLEAVVGKKTPNMFYQPQYNYQNQCVGAEALLRWEHPVYGMIYPPLVIKLLEEMDILTRAEEVILERVLGDMNSIKAVYGEDIKISVNVTGTTIQLDHYEYFLAEMAEKYPQHVKNMMLEITEQASLQIDKDFILRLNRIKAMGYRLAIDDFSMGNTSIKYLQNNVFSMVKLDGALIRDILANERSRSIVQTMTHLTEEFDIDILAEYVETEQQRDLLNELGCHLYQGYLYCKAVPIDEFLKRGY